jgi:hypothetical protein
MSAMSTRDARLNPSDARTAEVVSSVSVGPDLPYITFCEAYHARIVCWHLTLLPFDSYCCWNTERHPAGEPL